MRKWGWRAALPCTCHGARAMVRCDTDALWGMASHARRWWQHASRRRAPRSRERRHSTGWRLGEPVIACLLNRGADVGGSTGSGQGSRRWCAVTDASRQPLRIWRRGSVHVVRTERTLRWCDRSVCGKLRWRWWLRLRLRLQLWLQRRRRRLLWPLLRRRQRLRQCSCRAGMSIDQALRWLLRPLLRWWLKWLLERRLLLWCMRHWCLLLLLLGLGGLM